MDAAALPLFTDVTLPSTVAQLESSLGITLAFESPDDYSMGSAYLPRDPEERLTPLVESVSFSYPWDLYHQRQLETLEQLRRQSLTDWIVRFTSDSAACEALLCARHGPPTVLRREKLTYRVYGPLYLVAVTNGIFTLSWYARTPDWAVTGVEVGARGTLLRALADAADRAQRADELAAVVARPQRNAGVHLTDPDFDEGDGVLSLELKPPLAAGELIALLGWRNVVGVSHGMHMDHWTIDVITGVNQYRLETEAPRRGRWRIVASLDGWPSGETRPECDGGPIGQRDLGGDELVRYLRLERVAGDE